MTDTMLRAALDVVADRERRRERRSPAPDPLDGEQGRRRVTGAVITIGNAP